MAKQNKDFIALRNFPVTQLKLLLSQATHFKALFNRPNKQSPALRGKTIANLFFESSTRTRSAFEMASKMLGASVMNLTVSASSVNKGETILDTVRNLKALGIDCIIVRHDTAGVPQMIADNIDISVCNAGDGFNEHPTQGLLDIFTMLEHCKNLKGKKVTIVGDIKHSRVARSNIYGLNMLGAEVTVCGPPSLMPLGIAALGVTVEHDLKKALAKADFINVLRIQMERQKAGYLPSLREYNEVFGITAKTLEYAPQHAIVMHPGPINRGVEMSSEVVDSKRNVIMDQVTNGVAARMAVLYYLMTGDAN